MPRPARQPANRSSSNGGQSTGDKKRSQHDRLVDAVIELSARDGYQAVSVAQVSSRAGVSSATFYEQFKGKEDCFVSGYRTVAERVLGDIQAIAADVDSDAEWARAAKVALASALMAVRDDPNGGRVLLIESLAGGELMQSERRRVLAEFESRAQDLLESTPAGADTLDLPATALVGAIRSIASRHLRSDTEDELPGLADDLVAWLRAYSVPPGHSHWSTSHEALLEVDGRPLATVADDGPPKRLPRGRHGLPASVVARSQRTRIIYGTAQVMMAKGYANATVSDIVAAAGVARDVFYEHFADKQHAFLEAQQHPTQHILDMCAAAYFASERWPDRVWHGLRTLLELIAENPALSHLRLVECYAAGPEAIRRAEEITRSFTIFLEEGYHVSTQAAALPRLCSQAISGAIFESIRRHIAEGEAATLTARLPQLTYVAIAPFMGAEQAVRELRRLSAERSGHEGQRALAGG